MHSGQIGDAVGPERLRMREVDAALRREAGMADAVAAPEAGHGEGTFEVARRPDLLEELEVAAEADELEILAWPLERPGDLASRCPEAKLEAHEAGVLLVSWQPDPGDIEVLPARPEESQPSGIRAATGEAREHVEEDPPDGLGVGGRPGRT